MRKRGEERKGGERGKVGGEERGKGGKGRKGGYKSPAWSSQNLGSTGLLIVTVMLMMMIHDT